MEKKKKFRLPLSAYLTYLLFALFLFSFTTFSSYVTSTDNSVTGRSAVFEVIVDSKSETLVLDANEDILTDNFDFSVKSNSEIATYYDVLIDLKMPLPEGMSIKLDTKTADSVDGTVYKFNRVGEFTPLDKNSNNHSLVFSISEDLEEDIELNDLQIKVLISQQD